MSKHPRYFSYVFLLCLLVGLAHRTSNAQTANSSAIKNAPKADLKAGEIFTFSIEPKDKLAFKGQIDGCFNRISAGGTRVGAQNVVSFCCVVGGIEKGQTSALMSCSLPHDLEGGLYTSPNKWSYTRYGYSQRVEIQTEAFDVTVIPEEPVSLVPESAELKLQLTDQQLLRTKAQGLQKVLDTLTTDSNDKSANTNQLRMRLITTVQQADQILLDTRKNISSGGPNKRKTAEIMFEDFDRYYKASLTELRAPALSASGEKIGYTTVSLQERPHTADSVTINGHETKASHSFGLMATAIVDLLSENIAAFRKFATSGDDSFHFGLVSEPPGASVSYVRIGEDEQNYSRLTNVEDATLPFAKWTFLFRKEGCDVLVVKPNLYYEDHAIVTAPLLCRKPK